MHELRSMVRPGLFNVVILDYYLDELKTYLRGTDVAKELIDTPTLLVSHSTACLEEKQNWPDNIRKFSPKKLGADNLLEEALRIAAKDYF